MLAMLLPWQTNLVDGPVNQGANVRTNFSMKARAKEEVLSSKNQILTTRASESKNAGYSRDALVCS